MFNCRHCGGAGDGIQLVCHARNIEFKEALKFLCGEEIAPVDPETEKRREREDVARRKKLDDYAARAREYARKEAVWIWQQAVPAGGTIVMDYLELRGLKLATVPKTLRFIPQHPFKKFIAKKPVIMHTGPAMIAAIQDPGGLLSAVHQTWFDLSSPDGKARIEHEGVKQKSKLVRGSKKAGAIRLHTPRICDTIVMGEGIETTATAWVAGAIENAAYWAGVDLGNMAGKMARISGQRYSGEPDLEDTRAFVPPQWCKNLVFIQDGDSEPVMTRAKLMSGLKRAYRHQPGMAISIVHAGIGRDLNDIVRGIM